MSVMTTVRVRDAVPEDAEGILPIYNYAVAETTAVWNDTPVDAASRRAWIAQRQGQGYPVLVAEAGGEILGFASFGDFRAWDGYRHTVENSVYVAPASHRRGVGRALMSELVARGRGLGKHVMVAAVEASNTASLRLHESAGFVEVGRLPEVGCKFGRWLDMVLLQRRLDEAARLPG